jgi:hypothetical protein
VVLLDARHFLFEDEPERCAQVVVDSSSICSGWMPAGDPARSPVPRSDLMKEILGKQLGL